MNAKVRTIIYLTTTKTSQSDRCTHSGRVSKDNTHICQHNLYID